MKEKDDKQRQLLVEEDVASVYKVNPKPLSQTVLSDKISEIFR